MTPLISIVIANYNYGRYLEEAIQSIVSQEGFCRCELIVCDGGSTDDSVEVLRKYQKYITWWCSEPDAGQSDAFNKGFSHAKGRFVTWLNADDIFLPGALSSVIRAIDSNPTVRWFAGGSVWANSEMRLERCFRSHKFSVLRARAGALTVGGPSSFFEKSLLDEVGGIDVALHFVMDSDLWCKFYFHAGQRYACVKSYVWAFRIHKDSKMSGPVLDPQSEESRVKRARLKEETEILNKRYGFVRGGILMRLLTLVSVSLMDSVLQRVDQWRLNGCDVRKMGAVV